LIIKTIRSNQFDQLSSAFYDLFGSGDTQQYIKHQGVWISESRFQAKRGQVEGLRGLGAILYVLSK